MTMELLTMKHRRSEEIWLWKGAAARRSDCPVKIEGVNALEGCR